MSGLLCKLLLLLSSAAAIRIDMRRARVNERRNLRKALLQNPKYQANYAGSLSCDSKQWHQFLKKFGPGNGSLGISTSMIGEWFQMRTDFDLAWYKHQTRKPCQKGNVLWLMGTADHNNAFKYSRTACYSLLEWSKKACSVVVRKVASNQDAVTALDQYPYDSIKHIAFAGHGGGNLLRWSDEPIADLTVGELESKGVVLKAGRRMMEGGTIFLDSCLGGTFHEEECMGHYLSRMMGKGITVTSSVHEFDAVEAAIEVDQSDFRAVVIHGTRIFKHAVAEMETLHARSGDWVRCYYRTPEGLPSQHSSVGLVVAASNNLYTVRLKDLQGQIQANLPGTWITRRVKKGETVFLPITWEQSVPPPSERLVYQGGDPGAPDANWFILANPLTGVMVKSASLWPVGQQPEVLGRWYPKVGDWIKVDKDSPSSKNEDVRYGIVLGETRKGAMVLFVDEKQEGTKSLNVDPQDFEDVGKPGDRVEYYQEGKSRDFKTRIFDALHGDQDLRIGTMINPIRQVQEPTIYIHDEEEGMSYVVPVQFIKRVVRD